MPQTDSVSYRRHSLAAAISLALAASGAQAATFDVTSTNDSGAGSLREAITDANSAAGPHTIDFSAVSGQTITLASDLPEINEDLTLQGSDVTLDGDGANVCLSADGADLEVNDMTVTACVGTGTGAGYGGGISAYAGDLTINNSNITGNYADVGGGVILYGYYNDLTILDSTISGNQAIGGGGGVAAYLIGGYITISDSAITGNSAAEAGGIYAFGGTTVLNSEISGNEADFAGGGILESDSKYSLIADSSISNNSATGAVGGLYARGIESSLVVASSTLSGNAGGDAGGAAAIFQYESGDLYFVNNTISGNEAEYGAGVLINMTGSEAAIEMVGQTITGNTATGYGGGGVLAGFSYETSFPIRNSIIAGNSATADTDLGAFGGGARTVDMISEHRSGRIVERFGDEGLMNEARGFGTAPDNTIFDVTFSLIGEAPDSGIFNPDTVTGNLLGTPEQLGALADNGGPTLTHLPDAASPAVDAIPSGTNGCGGTFDIDQRGEPRPEGGGCEMGSVERGTEPPPPEPMMVPVLDRIGLLVLGFGAGLLGLLGLHRQRQRH